MFPIRRAALRFLSTPSVGFATRTRSITSLAASAARTQKQISPLVYQRRWASDEAKKEDLPISQLQATPQEEVGNAIIEDNAAQTVESSTEAPTESTQASNTASSVTGNSTAEGRSQESQADASSPVDPAVARMTPKPTIYVGNLFFDVTEDDLTKELARFGQVKKVVLIRDARGLSKGYGYVTFSSTEEASDAVANLNQQLYEGRRLQVAYAAFESRPRVGPPRSDKAMNPPTKTLFIGNMSWEMTDRDLNNLFRGIKNVIDVRVAIDRRTGQPRGFAHADFTDVKSAMEGMKALEGKETYGRILRLDYSHAPSGAPRNQARDRGDL